LGEHSAVDVGIYSVLLAFYDALFRNRHIDSGGRRRRAVRGGATTLGHLDDAVESTKRPVRVFKAGLPVLGAQPDRWGSGAARGE
jgi:hypothetical protein